MIPIFSIFDTECVVVMFQLVIDQVLLCQPDSCQHETGKNINCCAIFQSVCRALSKS